MMAPRTTTLITASVLVSASVLLAACASGPTVRTNVSPTAQFTSYRTYGFVAEPGTNRAGYSTPITGYFKEAIQREMDARGYRHEATAPDLLINFNANARESVDLQTRPATTYGMGYYGYRGGLYTAPMYVGTEVETVRYKTGTANVDVVDASRKELIWEGIAEGRLSDKAMQDPRAVIDSVVKELFAKYPGAATAR